MSIDLRLGRWQDALAGVTCDALIVDAPYSARTHGGHDSAPTVAQHRDALGGWDRNLHDRHRSGAGVTGSGDTCVRRSIGYDGWSHDDVRSFVASWSPRTSGWMVSITDHVLAQSWSEAMAEHGRYVFSPIPWVAQGSRVRLTGDGPSSWTCWIIVGRPSSDLRTGRKWPWKTFRDGTALSKWGTLPGAYVITQDRNIVVGGKPLDLMRAIVRDYSRPGDLVCDPCAGGATTLLAAAIEGRLAIGAEMDVDTHAQALARIARGYTPVMQMPEVRAVQGGLELGGGA